MAGRSTGQHMPPQQALKTNGNNAPPKPKTPRAVTLRRHACLTTPVVKPSPLQPPSEQTATPPPSSFRTSFRDSGMKISGISAARRRIPPELRLRCREATAREGRRRRSSRGILSPPPPEPVKESPSDIGATSKEKNNIVIPEFSAWLTLVLEQCRAENIRNLPRQRAPTPLFPERRPREACSMPISGCHDLPLATFNLPSRVFRHGCRRAECLERRWGGFFHTPPSGETAPNGRPAAAFFAYN